MTKNHHRDIFKIEQPKHINYYTVYLKAMEPFNHQLHTIEAFPKHQLKISKHHSNGNRWTSSNERREEPERLFTNSIIQMLHTELFETQNRITNATSSIKSNLSKNEK